MFSRLIFTGISSHWPMLHASIEFMPDLTDVTNRALGFDQQIFRAFSSYTTTLISVYSSAGLLKHMQLFKLVDSLQSRKHAIRPAGMCTPIANQCMHCVR